MSNEKIESLGSLAALLATGSVIPTKDFQSYKGVIMAQSKYGKRKARLRMAKRSRSLNRK